MTDPAPKKPKKLAVDEAQEAMDTLKEDLQRVQADFINFKRRIDSERGELMEAAKAAVIAEMLPLFDNLDRALGHTPEELKDNAWVLGVEQVTKQLPEALGQLGVINYGQVGETFDPNLHEAVDHDGGGHDITAVLQKGYRIDNKVIRPAMVRVGEVKGDK